jgi:hypothetical protein
MYFRNTFTRLEYKKLFFVVIIPFFHVRLPIGKIIRGSAISKRIL